MTLKLAYFGHIMRSSGSPLTLQIVEGNDCRNKVEQVARRNNGLTTSESGQD